VCSLGYKKHEDGKYIPFMESKEEEKKLLEEK